MCFQISINDTSTYGVLSFLCALCQHSDRPAEQFYRCKYILYKNVADSEYFFCSYAFSLFGSLDRTKCGAFCSVWCSKVFVIIFFRSFCYSGAIICHGNYGRKETTSTIARKKIQIAHREETNHIKAEIRLFVHYYCCDLIIFYLSLVCFFLLLVLSVSSHLDGVFALVFLVTLSQIVWWQKSAKKREKQQKNELIRCQRQ